MKIKYFLRGLGAGVIFGAMIMLAAYMLSGNKKMTDDEIRERASELGMVEQNVIIGTDTDAESTETTTEITTEDATEITTEDTTEITTEEITEDVTTTSEIDTTSGVDLTTETVSATIEVLSGMSSTSVCEMLEQAGIIDDAYDFDNYLNQNGYSSNIRVNSYEFSNDMTYEEIASELVKEVN